MIGNGLNNVLKFDPSQKRKPEPEAKKPQNGAARFVWISAVVGPLGSALFLMLMFGFSDLWNAITNPTVGGYWLQIGRLFGTALAIGVVGVPFSLISLGSYAMAVNKGFVLLRSIFVRRAVMAGGIYGVSLIVVLYVLMGTDLGGANTGELVLGVVLGGFLGAAVSFLWAHVCWIIGGAKLSPKTNDNR